MWNFTTHSFSDISFSNCFPRMEIFYPVLVWVPSLWRGGAEVAGGECFLFLFFFFFCLRQFLNHSTVHFLISLLLVFAVGSRNSFCIRLDSQAYFLHLVGFKINFVIVFIGIAINNYYVFLTGYTSKVCLYIVQAHVSIYICICVWHKLMMPGIYAL